MVAARAGGALPAVREKYALHRFKCVAVVEPAEAPLPAALFQ